MAGTTALLAIGRPDRYAIRRLGLLLAFIAGAINAGGFMAVGRYTSHITGVLSGMADAVALGDMGLALAGMLMVSAFCSGAFSTSLLVNWARVRNKAYAFAVPLGIEGILLIVFGLCGPYLSRSWLGAAPAVLLLCFIMGLQNAVITKISRHEIRTTHMTGVATDLGIELGRRVFRTPMDATGAKRVPEFEPEKLRLLVSLLALFLAGGVLGALMFAHWKYAAAFPFAAILCGLSFAAMKASDH